MDINVLVHETQKCTPPETATISEANGMTTLIARKLERNATKIAYGLCVQFSSQSKEEYLKTCSQSYVK